MKTTNLKLEGQTPNGRKFEILSAVENHKTVAASLTWLPANGLGSFGMSVNLNTGDLFHALTTGAPIKSFLRV